MTHTRTHVYVPFANPWLVCEQCRATVTGWHDSQRCGSGCEMPAENKPCGHVAGTVSVCPSWGPVDGCTCPDPAADHRA